MIKINVPGVPVPQARPRFTRGGYVYEPSKCKDYKAVVAAAARAAMRGKTPITGPVYVYCDFVMPIPKGWSKAKKEDALNGAIQPLKRPDGDNLEKLIWDALTGIVWSDDAQIVQWAGAKWYGEPETVVKVVEIGVD